MKKFVRQCPNCNREITYKHEVSQIIAGKEARQCKNCASSSRIRTEEWNRKIGLGNMGKVRTRETKDKISNAGLGRIPWNKGLSKTNDIRLQNLSDKLKGYNKGKTFDQIHGKEMAVVIREKISKSNTGLKRSDEIKKRFSEIQRIAQSGKKLTEQHKENISRGLFNTLSADKYNSYKEWKLSFTDRDIYYKKVRKITEEQPLHLLENNEKRGRVDYHVDHIIPISYGFANNLPPELIGNILNLQMLYYKENIKKGNSHV